MARGLLGRGHPLQRLHQRRQALREADCVLLAGAPCDFRLDYGRHVRRSANLIAANRSAREARLNRRPDVAAIGDAGDFLVRLAARVEASPRRDRTGSPRLRARDEAREARSTRGRKRRANSSTRSRCCARSTRRRRTTPTFVADGGDFVATASYVLRPRAPRGWLDPGVFGTLGVGAGFALAAALERPDAEVWILFGDGACGWSLAEFDTFVRHGIPVVAVVGNDAGWTQIAREQVKMLGDDVGVTLSRAAYHEVAAAFGAEGILVKQRRRSRRGPRPRPRRRARRPAGAGQRLARPLRFPRRVDLDVSGEAAAARPT